MMKKILLFVALLIVSVFLFNLHLEAANFTSPYSRNIDEAITNNVSGPMVVNKQHVETINNGVTNTSSSSYYYNAHTIQWVDFDTKSDYKVVTYSGLNADSWKQMTTRQAAADFEKNHPGWLVVAGINGDFFDNSGNPPTFQPTNNYMTMGDMFRAQVAGAEYRKVLGWKSDGSLITGDPNISSKMYMRVLNDKGEITSDDEIKVVNKTLSETGINLITNHTTTSFDFSGYTVYVCKYSINRISSGGYIFVKGEVESINTSLSSSNPGTGYFYLCSKDNSLQDKLSVGTKLKCEYKYQGDWTDVQNSIGYVYQVLKDNEPQLQESTDSFCNITHPRTLVGFRNDESMVMMVVDGRGKASEYKTGATLFECGEMLRLLGCKDGYNLDGGGSSTLVVRNEFGSFNVVNTPSDGGERADGNHILVIMRDPGFKVSYKAENKNLVVNLDITNEDYFKNLSNIKITINGVTKDYNSDGTSFPNLDLYKPQEIEITYDDIDNYTGSTRVNKKIISHCELEYETINPRFKVSSIGKDYVEITRDMTIPEAAYFKNIVITIGDLTYNMGDKASLKCENLIAGTVYDVSYNYVYDDPNMGPRNEDKAGSRFSTTNYNLPVFDEFEIKDDNDNTLSITYKYTDSSKVVKKATVYVNDTVLNELSAKRGTIRVPFGDNDELKVKVVLDCEYDGNSFTIESELITYKIEKTDPTPSDPTPTPTPEPEPSNPEPEPTPEQQTEKKKCGKKSSELILMFFSLTSVIYLLRKKKEV